MSEAWRFANGVAEHTDDCETALSLSRKELIEYHEKGDRALERADQHLKKAGDEIRVARARIRNRLLDSRAADKKGV